MNSPTGQAKKCKTIFKKSVLTNEHATILYEYLYDNIDWEEGVRSKYGKTRKAKPLNYGDIPEIDYAIDTALKSLSDVNYYVTGVYLNFYENGESWTPNHTHKGTHQLVISLGGSRNLIVSKNTYTMENGDCILFGSAVHGVPKTNEPVQPRISIATFMTPLL